MQLEHAFGAAKRILKMKQEEELPPQLRKAIEFAQSAMIRCMQQKMTEYDVLLLCSVHQAYGVCGGGGLTIGESSDSVIVDTPRGRGRPLGSKNRTLQEVTADG